MKAGHLWNPWTGKQTKIHYWEDVERRVALCGARYSQHYEFVYIGEVMKTSADCKRCLKMRDKQFDRVDAARNSTASPNV